MWRHPRRPSRSSGHDLERRIADFYASVAPQRAPDLVFEAALATTDPTCSNRSCAAWTPVQGVAVTSNST